MLEKRIATSLPFFSGTAGLDHRTIRITEPTLVVGVDVDPVTTRFRVVVGG